MPKKDKEVGIQLDFFSAPEVNQELLRLARLAGYGDNVHLYLANNGQPIKHVPDPEASRKKLEARKIKDGLADPLRIDPAFVLHHQMVKDAQENEKN